MNFEKYCPNYSYRIKDLTAMQEKKRRAYENEDKEKYFAYYCLCLGFLCNFRAIWLNNCNAASGIKYESETNDVSSSANQTYDDYDNYGRMTLPSDIDYWKIIFNYSGSANFFLGNIPSGCNYDMRLYASNGTTLLANSTLTGNANEFFTYNVTANTNYYIRVSSSYGYSGNYYLFRAKLYPSKTLNVPIYQQATTTTCNAACGRMILKYYGITVSEIDFKNKANSLAGAGDDYTYVYVVRATLNWYLNNAGNATRTRYKYTNTSSYSNATYQDLVLKNIMNSHPVLPAIKITNTTYFPYTSNGHYVTIRGMIYSSSSGTYTAGTNDPHYTYSGLYNIPISAMHTYNKAHGGYLIHVDS